MLVWSAARLASQEHAVKKRKLDADPTPAADADVTWTVWCLDGSSFSVAVPEHTRVAEVKRAIGAAREVKDVEDALDDDKRITVGRVPLFMLPKVASDRLALEALFKSTGVADWTRDDGWMPSSLGD